MSPRPWSFGKIRKLEAHEKKVWSVEIFSLLYHHGNESNTGRGSALSVNGPGDPQTREVIEVLPYCLCLASFLMTMAVSLGAVLGTTILVSPNEKIIH
jgi:hypothetical protein